MIIESDNLYISLKFVLVAVNFIRDIHFFFIEDHKYSFGTSLIV